MQASIIDLRYHMKKVIKALDRNEEVTVLYHGKPKAVMKPIKKSAIQTNHKVTEHPFFGMSKQAKEPVKMIMQKLRGNRYDSI